MLITAEMIMDWRPCEDYPRERVQELVGGGLTPLEICDLPIPPKDRLWVLLRREVLDDQVPRGIACRTAEKALCRYGAVQADGTRGDPRSWEAVRVAQLYAVGEARSEELYSAWTAAWDATWQSTRGAARTAAWAAARAATWAAAWDAAWAAAEAATWDATRGEMLADVRAVLDNNDDLL